MVVDAFRVSTTIAVLVRTGARVIPVASVEEAATYVEADYRVGERGSIKVRGFDFVNAHAAANSLATGAWGTRVAVIDCGWKGHRFGEDESAAGAILHRLWERGAGLDERAKCAVGLYLARPEKLLPRNSAVRCLYASDMRRTSISASPRTPCLSFLVSKGMPSSTGDKRNLARGPNGVRWRSQNVRQKYS